MLILMDKIIKISNNTHYFTDLTGKRNRRPVLLHFPQYSPKQKTYIREKSLWWFFSKFVTFYLISKVVCINLPTSDPGNGRWNSGYWPPHSHCKSHSLYTTSNEIVGFWWFIRKFIWFTKIHLDRSHCCSPICKPSAVFTISSKRVTISWLSYLSYLNLIRLELSTICCLCILMFSEVVKFIGFGRQCNGCPISRYMMIRGKSFSKDFCGQDILDSNRSLVLWTNTSGQI